MKLIIFFYSGKVGGILIVLNNVLKPLVSLKVASGSLFQNIINSLPIFCLLSNLKFECLQIHRNSSENYTHSIKMIAITKFRNKMLL